MMDAKPTRPLYAMASRGNNENLPPTGQQGLHQRHKSNNANLLNAMPGNINLALKSNGADDVKKPIALDEGSIAKNSTNSGLDRAPVQVGQRALKTLGQPAVTNNNLKPITHIIKYPVNPRRAPIPVYNDNQSEKENDSTDPKGAKFSSQPIRPVPTTTTTTQTTEDSKQVSLGRHLDQIRIKDICKVYDHDEHKDSSSSTISAASQAGSQADPQTGSQAGSQANKPSIVQHVKDDVTEDLYLDAVEEMPSEEKYPVLVPEKNSEPCGPLPSSWKVPSHSPSSDEKQVIESKSVDPQVPQPSSILTDDQPDLSDYEDEDYDDQGYTTAHSVRDTTGGVTTVMVPPKLSEKGVQEMENAKCIVENKLVFEGAVDDGDWEMNMVSEYSDEIFSYMKEMETDLMPDAHYMDQQTDIKWSMRAVLMDWVIQVHGRFGLYPETLFLAVNFIDRFLSNKVVSLGKLQLVGATAILIAAKYEEINCPSLNEIVYMVDHGYTLQEVVKAERFMLNILGFNLGWPGPLSFMRRISKADDYDSQIRSVAKYFMEVTIMDERFVASPPSYIAAGAQCLGRLILGKGDWTPAHVYYSGYTYTQLKPLIGLILDCCRQSRKHHKAVFEKFSAKQHRRASLYVEDRLLEGFSLPFQYRAPSIVPAGLFDDLLFPSEYEELTMPIPSRG